MDLPYATIPICENTYVTLYQDKVNKYHVEDPHGPMNELVFFEEDIGNFTILENSITPREDSNVMWKMRFDGA